MHIWYRQFRTLRVSVTSFYVIRRDAYTVSGAAWIRHVRACAPAGHVTVDVGLLKNAKFQEGFKKWMLFSHLSQILYELEKKSSLVTRALSAKSCTRDTDSLHSCTRLRLVQEMACLYHSCKILPRKHSYPNLIPIWLGSYLMEADTGDVEQSQCMISWSCDPCGVRCKCYRQWMQIVL